MLKAANSGRNSAFSEWLKLSTRVWFSLSLILLLAIAGVSCVAQSASSSISAYADAIKQSTISERIPATDRSVARAGSSELKTYALEFLVWDYFRLGHQSPTAQRGKEL